MNEIDKIIAEVGNINAKMGALIKAQKVGYAFNKMDSATQDVVKDLINHLMIAKIEKDINEDIR